jgi:hypothetical protein
LELCDASVAAAVGCVIHKEQDMKKNTLKHCLIPVFFLAYQSLAGQLGVNIGLPERGGTFVDIAKENYRWSKAGTGAALASVDVDSSGWPKTDVNFVLDQRPATEWAGTVDDPLAYHLDLRGTYHCALLGRASIRSQGQGSVQNMVYDSAANTTTFDFVVTDAPGPGGGFLDLEFTSTRRTAVSATGTGFTRFRMNRPGYPLSTSKTFTDDFLAALNGINFSAIRYMVFTNVSGMDPLYPGKTTWGRRKLKTDAGQNPIPPLGKTDGAAWEYVIELANTVNKDAWINVPISADAQYVRNLAQLFKDSLKANLNIYVESSNEVWNSAPGYEECAYNKAWAQTLGITEHQNHARRAVSLAMSFDSVFGAGALNNRVRVVLCSHKPMLKWWVEPMLQYVNTTFGPPGNFIWAIGCQTYFSGGVDTGESVSKILSDCHLDIKGQIDETGGVNEAGRVQWIAKAKAWNLKGGFVSYEGGPDHGGGSTLNIANRISAERDSLMGEMLKYNYDTAFLALGGALAMQFTLSSGYSRYGCWGLTDDIANPNRNYKYRAIKSIIGGPAAVRAAAPVRASSQSEISVVSRSSLCFKAEPGMKVTLTLHTVSGQTVKTLYQGVPQTGTQEVAWNARSLAHGLYVLRLVSGDTQIVRRVSMGR